MPFETRVKVQLELVTILMVTIVYEVILFFVGLVREGFCEALLRRRCGIHTRRWIITVFVRIRSLRGREFTTALVASPLGFGKKNVCKQDFLHKIS